MEKKYRRMLEAMRNDYRLEERSLQEHNRVCELDTGGGLPNGDSPNASLASAAALRLAGVDWAPSLNPPLFHLTPPSSHYSPLPPTIPP